MVTIELDELKTWPTERLRAARDEAVVKERRWRLRRVELDRLLDDRGATGTQDAAEWIQTRDKVRATTAFAEVEVGRALESLPELRAVAERGDLSFDQLAPLVQLATPETDAEWALRGPHVAPSELNRMARRIRIVTAADDEARERARDFRWWRSGDDVLRVSGSIPGVNGAYVEAVFEHMINAMKPPPGQAWASRGNRGADALLDLCRIYRKDESAPATRWKPTVVIHVGSEAQPEVNGMPLALRTVQQLIADGAKVREVADDDPLAPTSGDDIPTALREYLKARDPQCRRPGCERSFGLDAHHMVPRCQGGETSKTNVVMVCKTDHKVLVPHGPYVLEGDPERPDGLTWRKIDESESGTGDARAGP